MKLTPYTCLFLGLFCVPIALAQTGVIVTVNGQKITQKEVDRIAINAAKRGIKDTTEFRQAVLNELILKEAILQDAKKIGLEKKGDNPEKIKLAQQQVLQELWFEEYVKTNPISESDLRADYDRQANLTKEGRNSNEYKISQIIVATEAEAKEIIQQVSNGAIFEKIAREKSLDKATGAQGGIIPNWILPDMVVAPLGDALVNLSGGKLDPQPVRTNLGWHVVRVEEVRKFVMPSFESAQSNIYQGLLAKKKQEAVDALIKKTIITKAN